MPIPPEWDLTGKAALITADARGWTPYLAGALAEAGADVAVVGPDGSDRDDGAAAVEAQGRRALAIEARLTDPEEVEAAVHRTVSEFGKIDILVNNAQVEFGKPFLEVTDQEWQAVMDRNVRSVFLLCQVVGRYMVQQGRGRIVNISSGLSERGLWNSVALCAAHGAIHQLTAALALEWGRSGVRVNAIGAGWMTTDRSRLADESELLVRYIPSRRKGHPEDLCGLLVYLASDACDFVTGQTFFIDGGALAHA